MAGRLSNKRRRRRARVGASRRTPCNVVGRDRLLTRTGQVPPVLQGGKSGVSRFAGICAEAGEGRGIETGARGSGPDPGDYRSGAARGAGQGARAEQRGAGAAVREAERVTRAVVDQCVWKRAADGNGVGGERPERSCRTYPGISEDGDAAGALRQNQDVAEAGGAGIVFPEESERGRMQGSGAARGRRKTVRLPDPEMLAAGRRAVYHVSAGVHEESGNGEAQRGDVPDAGLRRMHHGNALADAEARGRAFSAGAGEKSRRTDSGERGDRDRSRDGPGGDAADSAGPG